MLAKISSGAVVGLDGVAVTVEVDIASRGLPSFTIVGLPDKAIEESRERVRAAIVNSGGEFPGKRITVNLAPADLPKNGPSYDFPIALGILAASEKIPFPGPDTLFIGELSLDGTTRHVNGILPLVEMARSLGYTAVFVPAVDAAEASVVSRITVIPVASLLSYFHHATNIIPIKQAVHTPADSEATASAFDFDLSDIRGQEQAKRALEIAAAGAHNIFLQGPPGAGKTMLARTLPSILPSMTETESLEVTKIFSITGNLPSGTSLVRHRPFRSPHHTTSGVGLIGGGAHPSPGEISLAHRGVLFLDEFPEFPRSVLESLRQPMEDGVVTISRASGSITFPAKFMLVAAANPCPCGNAGSETKRCTCLPGMVSRYQKRISGPIIDRIDLHLTVPSVDMEKLTSQTVSGEPSKVVRLRVEEARQRQIRRFRGTGIVANADLTTKQVGIYCILSEACRQLLRQAVSKMGLSARSYYRIIKLSRTIADLADSRDIDPTHIAEALQYRPVQ